MVAPPRDERPDADGELPEGATPPPADGAVGDDTPERASEIDDVTDSMLRPESGIDDGFDEIVGELDYSDVDVPALLAEREEYKGLAQRLQADFENYRKRASAQSLAEADRASGRLAEALLPVLDAAEAAFVRHPDEVGPLLNQMLGELKKHGLETLDLEGKPFDPEYAEAVAHEPGDGGEPVVSEVLRSGYTWKGRVLRAAMVKTKD
ncbi:MAG TPA: nucleotide exchange factor GrpE [Ilumatobacteraceae bacterium]|nr:nucleotide exchange factor GrpE [Ilumatobacteraceae bacterium]